MHKMVAGKKKHTPESIQKIKDAQSGEKSYNWKGDSVGYAGLHQWIKKQWGKAKLCEGENCKGNSARFEWANRSGKYKRVRSDWLQLCSSCHHIRDNLVRNFYVNKKERAS